MATFKETVTFIGRSAKRIAVAVVGGALVIAGIVLCFLPGPGFLVVVLGFTVLATEFAWANRALEVGKQKAEKVVGSAKRTASGAFSRLRRK